MGKKKKGCCLFKIIGGLFLLILIAAAIIGFKYYNKIFADNVNVSAENNQLFVPTGSTYDDLIAILSEKEILKNSESFDWVANKMNLKNHVYPGRYVIEDNLSNRKLIEKLRGGLQSPVEVTFNNVRTKEELAGKLGDMLEPDSIAFLNTMNDDEWLKLNDFIKEDVVSVCLPNTYEFYWNTSTSKFFGRMKSEFDKFWNDERMAKAKKLGLTRREIITLASIVEEETQKQDEKSRVAGVYVNRLDKGMKLQADPTVKFAVGDFTLKRILFKHLEEDSPYNTYMYTGLPPGPIRIPSAQSIDATLNKEDHKYIYFCAKEDFSGYHNFAVTYAEHLVNAKNYQNALNRLNR